jgi:hypothetical protein
MTSKLYLLASITDFTRPPISSSHASSLVLGSMSKLESM